MSEDIDGVHLLSTLVAGCRGVGGGEVGLVVGPGHRLVTQGTHADVTVAVDAVHGEVTR